MDARAWWAPLGVALGLGALEAAWTSPAHGAPARTTLGIAAILLALVATTWPRPWRVPGLAILEEAVHLFLGYGGRLPDAGTLFHHWSAAYLGFNTYPWITMPALTLAAEILFRLRRQPSGVATPSPSGEHEIEEQVAGRNSGGLQRSGGSPGDLQAGTPILGTDGRVRPGVVFDAVDRNNQRGQH